MLLKAACNPHTLRALTLPLFLKVLPSTGERIYRTGDLGRFAPHGLGLDILGRAGDDGMVKVGVGKVWEMVGRMSSRECERESMSGLGSKAIGHSLAAPSSQRPSPLLMSALFLILLR